MLVEWYWVLISVILALVLGLVVGFFLSKYFFTKYLKKNPPINADMIRAMYGQMGRKPSELQVRSVVNAMKKYQK